MAAHSKLGPSGAHRWMNCPGSIRRSAGIKSESSVYAAEGTAAHKLAEHCMRNGYSASRFLGWTVGEDLIEKTVKPDGKTTFEIDREMADAVQEWLDHCRGLIEPGDEWEVEVKVDMSHLHPDIFGTADIAIYKPKAKKLICRDYKHGVGLTVSIEDNEQLELYGIGAVRKYHNRGLRSVDIGIVQPRSAHVEGTIRTKEFDALDLLDWESRYRDGAARTDEDDALLAAGDWCKFCPAAGVCEELQRFSLDAARAEFDIETGEVETLPEPSDMEGERLAALLGQVSVIESWCKRVKEHAHHEAEAGRVPPGYKLVPSRATRRFKDTDAAAVKLLALGVPAEDLYGPRKLVSPKQAEGLLGKNKKDIENLIEKVSSGSVLAPLDDRRAPLRAEALEDFADSIEA